MNTKQKGQITEARVLYEFQKRGVPVAVPWGDNERYDLIAEFNGKLNKIQIKTANDERNGAIVCYCRSSTNHTTNKNLSTYENEIDYFVFFNYERDALALVPIEEVEGKTAIYLRLVPPANNQTVGIRYFKDYSFDKMINNSIV